MDVRATAGQWFAWLSQEEAKTRRAYLEKPSFLIADYLREPAITKNYEGRRILELLQNANDQAAEPGESGRVRIDLFSEGWLSRTPARHSRYLASSHYRRAT